jgi:hypothetical protein
MPTGTSFSAKYAAQLVLDWYLHNDEDLYSNKYNPIIISADANG